MGRRSQDSEPGQSGPNDPFPPLCATPRATNAGWDRDLASSSSLRIQFLTPFPQPASGSLPKLFRAHRKLQEHPGGGCQSHCPQKSHQISQLLVTHKTKCPFSSFLISQHGLTANWLERKPNPIVPCPPVKEDSHFWHLKDLNLIHGRGLNEGAGMLVRGQTPHSQPALIQGKIKKMSLPRKQLFFHFYFSSPPSSPSLPASSSSYHDA